MSRGGGRRLAPPPAKLPELPSFRSGPEPLWRIHRNAADPVAIASDEHGRFNLSAPRGTIYVATDPLGAFIEVFGRLALLDASEIGGYRLAELAAPGRGIADLTSRTVLGKVGLTAEIHSTTDYRLTRAWAEAIADAGHTGIRYLARHDPAGDLASIALFCGAGAAAPEVLATRRIPGDLLARAEAEFGLVTVPRRLLRR